MLRFTFKGIFIYTHFLISAIFSGVLRTSFGSSINCWRVIYFCLLWAKHCIKTYFYKILRTDFFFMSNSLITLHEKSWLHCKGTQRKSIHAGGLSPGWNSNHLLDVMEFYKGLTNVSSCLFLLNAVCFTSAFNRWLNKSGFMEFTPQIEKFLLLSPCLHTKYLLIQLVLI